MHSDCFPWHSCITSHSNCSHNLQTMHLQACFNVAVYIHPNISLCVCTSITVKGLTPQNLIYPPKVGNTLKICFRSCSKLIFWGHMLIWHAHFLLHCYAIHAISTTSFWFGPLRFSALQLASGSRVLVVLEVVEIVMGKLCCSYSCPPYYEAGLF